MSLRHLFVPAAAAIALAVTAAPAAQATPPAKKLTLSSYTVTVAAPFAPASVCDYNWINCGYIEVRATFAGLDRFPRPAGEVGPPEGNLSGTAQVTRDYGCQNAAGKRLHRYDETVSETVGLNTRRATGFGVPRAGDTVSSTTYAFLNDRQPGNCPAGTTPMTYRIVAKHVSLELDFYVGGLPDATYKAPGRSSWGGAVPTPGPEAS